MEERRGRIVQLFYNRSSGSHSDKRVADLRAGFEAHGAQVVLSECGPASPITIRDDADHVCALGGDGTIRHVAHAVAQSGRALPLSIYPAGTVNLLHREIGSPLDPHLHAARALGGEAAALHYAVEVNGTLFLACASVGPDSRAVDAVSSRLKRRIGKLAYAVAFAGVLLRWRRDAIRLSWDGGTMACEAFYVAKGRYFAGPWSFAPDAGLANPLLHVIALERARRIDFLRFAFAVMRGRRVSEVPGIAAFTCTDLSASAGSPLPVQADGDIVAALPARLTLRADPMSFC